MPRLFSSTRICRTLEKRGFVFVGQKGSHIKYAQKSLGLTVIVPANKKEIPFGTFKSILRQSKLEKKNFE